MSKIYMTVFSKQDEPGNVPWQTLHHQVTYKLHSMYTTPDAGSHFADSESMEGWVDLDKVQVNNLPKVIMQQCWLEWSSNLLHFGHITNTLPNVPRQKIIQLLNHWQYYKYDQSELFDNIQKFVEAHKNIQILSH